MPPHLWTQQQIATLVELWPRMSASQLADELRISRNAVVGKVYRLRSEGVITQYITKPLVPRTRGREAFTPKKRIRKKPQMTWQPKPDQPPRQAGPISCPCSLVELGPENCKWPIGDPLQSGFHFCGAWRADDIPYCAKHARIAWSRS